MECFYTVTKSYIIKFFEALCSHQFNLPGTLLMPEHQQTQQSKKTNTIFQKQVTPISQTPVSNPYSIIQRAKINPKSLTHADIMQLQRTIGNRAVGMLLTGIGSSFTAQQATVQKQEISEEEKACPSCMQNTVHTQPPWR